MDEGHGRIVFTVDGKGAREFFSTESGCHRWQHVPENQRTDRIQTSTITVAVIETATKGAREVKDSELEWDKPFRAGGKGGQHQNKVASACRVRHKKSGIVVECRTERSLHANQRSALELVKARVLERERLAAEAMVTGARRQQIGSGDRADKMRTYRERDDIVIDDRSGRKTSLTALRKGDWSAIK